MSEDSLKSNFFLAELFEKEEMPWYSKNIEEFPLSKFLTHMGKNEYLSKHTSKVVYWTYLIVQILGKFEDNKNHSSTMQIIDTLHIEQNNAPFDKLICELIINEIIKEIQEFEKDQKGKCTIKEDGSGKFNDQERDFLLMCALYHDIGKLFIKARHGPEGADILKDIRDDELLRFKQFNIDIGTAKKPNRKRIMFMSDLIRYHDYFGTLQTGEASYLLFLDVLNPIINNSLIKFESRFLRYLLFLNIADILATFFDKPVQGNQKFKIKKVQDCLNVLMNDYKKIECIKIEYDNQTSKNLVSKHKTEHLTEYMILSRNLNQLVDKLRQISEDTTCERFRRLLRTTCIVVLESEQYQNAEPKCKRYYDIKEWFEEGDFKPILSGLKDINWSNLEYRYLAFICKIDYGLSFLNKYFTHLILSEIENKTSNKKSPHDLRLDLAMNTIELVDVFVRTYGKLTQGEIRLGLGMERLNKIIDQEKKVFHTENDVERRDFEQKLIARLKGDKGHFKKAESYEKIKTGVNIWPYLP
jgi:hypothetical protein